jgi:hypothetical protein
LKIQNLLFLLLLGSAEPVFAKSMPCDLSFLIIQESNLFNLVANSTEDTLIQSDSNGHFETSGLVPGKYVHENGFDSRDPTVTYLYKNSIHFAVPKSGILTGKVSCEPVKDNDNWKYFYYHVKFAKPQK